MIARALRKNTRLTGLHFDRNDGYVDALGYLHPLPALRIEHAREAVAAEARARATSSRKMRVIVI